MAVKDNEIYPYCDRNAPTLIGQKDVCQQCPRALAVLLSRSLSLLPVASLRRTTPEFRSRSNCPLHKEINKRRKVNNSLLLGSPQTFFIELKLIYLLHNKFTSCEFIFSLCFCINILTANLRGFSEVYPLVKRCPHFYIPNILHCLLLSFIFSPVVVPFYGWLPHQIQSDGRPHPLWFTPWHFPPPKSQESPGYLNDNL